MKADVLEFILNTTDQSNGVWANNTEVKQAAFLSHGLKPEVNISHAKAVVSQILKLIVSILVKRYLKVLCGSVRGQIKD